MADLREDVTLVLEQMRKGDRNAADKLLPLVYDEFRALARHYLAQERAQPHRSSPPALVHEAYMKLVDQTRVDWQGSAPHFFAVAAQAIARILVDHARSRPARRANAAAAAPASSSMKPSPSPRKDEDVLALDEWLERLAALVAREA